MIRQNFFSKRTLLAGIFLFLMIISNISVIDNLNNIISNNKQSYSELIYNDKNPKNSDLNLTDYITGSGVNQTVRLYMENKSESIGNNKYFEIPAPADNMYLTYGDFNFTFQNNYTTDYILENNGALEKNELLALFQFNTNENYSSIYYNSNANLTKVSLNNLTDNKGLNSYFILNSSNGNINFTIKSSFENITSSGMIPYVRDKIIAFILNFTYNVSKNVNFTLKMKNFYDNSWHIIVNNELINSSLGPHNLDKTIINENLNYINSSDCTLIQFIFNRSDNSVFNATIFDFNLNSTSVFELAISNTTYIGLEFDLKGKHSTVNGFYAWIRTLNLTLAQDALLNITLYEANATIPRNNRLVSVKTLIKPDPNKKIDSFEIKYTKDEYHYFGFNISKTKDLPLSNYFIVIRSNISTPIFHIVVLSISAFGDEGSEHQVIESTNQGSNWHFAKTSLGSMSSGQVDASLFKINVTRGYMPSDFEIDGTISLQIQNITLENREISSYPYNESSHLTWGLGRWKLHDFPKAIANNSQRKFKIELQWNTSIVKDFLFNVTYFVRAYRVENALSSYNVTYDQIPIWTFNYSLNLSSNYFKNWNFSKFMYIYYGYFNATRLKTPIEYNAINKTTGEITFSENSLYDTLTVTTTIVNTSDITNSSGYYILYLQSPDNIYNIHSYINFNGTLWETRGFMYGDNISVRLEIQDLNSKAPISGNASVNLFYPNGTKVPNCNLTSNTGQIAKIDGTQNGYRYYDFDNKTIINLTNNLKVFGKYKLGFFWTNGTLIGCKSITIYIDAYNLNIQNCEYYPSIKANILQGTLLNKVYDNYSMLIASVNETTGLYRPNYFHINRTLNETEGSFTYKYNGFDLTVQMKDFLQNETVLNPGETVKFKVQIQNKQAIADLNVKVKIELVSIANEQWKIAVGESNVQTLKLYGDPNDTKYFNVSLTIPSLQSNNIWNGFNAPVRKAGAKTIVKVYIEDNLAGTYSSPDYSILINKTDDQFEGQVIAIKKVNDVSSKSILKSFARSECIYLPNKTTFIINIYDRYYISSYNEFLKSFQFKIDSKFINFSNTPEKPIKGLSVSFSTKLVDEFGTPLSNKQIIIQYNNSNVWEDLATKTTDSNGLISIAIETIDLNINNQLKLKLIWSGDNYTLGNTTIYTIAIIVQNNQISISSIDLGSFLYKNKNSTITFKIYNSGNSTLEIKDIKIEFDQNIKYSIRTIDYIKANRLMPDEYFLLTIEIEIPILDAKNLSITVKITAENIISTEIIIKTQTFNTVLLDRPIYEYFLDNLTLIIILILAFIIFLSILYRKKIIKKIEAPIEEEPKRKPRRGRYVKVSELPKQKEPEKKPLKPKPEKIQKKKIGTKEAKKERKVDLDELLEEKGFHDKKNKR
ncbi:MAG: hypothetical protein ACP6IY_15900 [Promethearchaeia archaeon]